VGVGSSLPETAAGIGILAGFKGIFGVFKTSSKYGFGLHSFGVSACIRESHNNPAAPKASRDNVEYLVDVVDVEVG